MNTSCGPMVLSVVERALIEACRRGHAEVIAFTVAPRPATSAPSPGGHDWLVEFAEPPRAPETFVRVLDETLQRLDADYRARRARAVGMLPPRVLELPAGTFYRWRRGDIPPIRADRAVADALLAAVAARTAEPLIAFGR